MKTKPSTYNSISYKLFLFSIFLFIFSIRLNAGDFKSIRLYAGVTYTLYNDEFSEIWKDITPFTVQFETNYFIFDITASVSYNHFESKKPEITDFHAARVDLCLSYPISVFNFAYLNFGIKAGNFFMFFDSESKYAGRESELFAAMDISLKTQTWKNFVARFSYEYGSIFTKRRINSSQISISTGYAFKTPHFIKEFLK